MSRVSENQRRDDEWQSAIHEGAHWLFAMMLDLDRANFVNVTPDNVQLGHVEFQGSGDPATLDHAIRQSLMLLAGYAAENIFLRDGLIAAPRSGRDRDEAHRLAGKFFPGTRDAQFRFVELCWTEANLLVRENREVLHQVARRIRGRGRIEANELADIWLEFRDRSADPAAAVARVRASLGSHPHDNSASNSVRQR